MPTSNIENSAMRLLGGIHDLAGGKLNEPVVIGGEEGGAAHRVGMDPGSTEYDVARNYLLNQNYIQDAGQDAEQNAESYTITVPGIDRVRELRGLSKPPNPRNKIDEQTQRRLMTIAAIGIAAVLSKPISNLVDVPERRGIKDDLLEAFLEGLVRAAAMFLAAVLVRKVAENWGE